LVAVSIAGPVGDSSVAIEEKRTPTRLKTGKFPPAPMPRFQPTAPATDQRLLRDTGLALVLAVAVGLWVPFARAEWLITNEGAAYAFRTIEWATERRAGELYPRWCPDFYGGYGSPLFIFDPPVIYALAGFLTTLSLDPFSALKAVTLLFSVVAGLGTYGLVFGETRRRDAALVGAIAYLAAPYRIANLYQRGDLGEFGCIAFLPAVLALYRAAAAEARPSRARWLAAAAAVVHALMIMTHAILGLWGTVLIGLVLIATGIQLLRRGLWRRVLLLLGAAICSQGLAAVYTIPAIVYRTVTHTAGMVVGYYHAPDNWIPLKVLFDPGPGENHLKVGALLVAAGIAAGLGMIVNFRMGRRALGWTFLTVLLMAATHQRASWFWEPGGLIPLTQFVQFPWRLVGPAVLTASVMLGIAMAALFERTAESTRTTVAYVGAAALLMAIAWPSVSPELRSLAGIASSSDAIRAEIQSATDADEYLPLPVAAPPRAPRRDLLARAEGATAAVNSEGSHHALVVRAERGGAVLHLALHGFPSWVVETVSGPAKATLDIDQAGMLQIHLPAPGDYRLRLRFGVSAAFRLGTFLSALSLLLLCLFLFRRSRFWRWPSAARVAHA
jgi:hypothetical protein